MTQGHDLDPRALEAAARELANSYGSNAWEGMDEEDREGNRDDVRIAVGAYLAALSDPEPDDDGIPGWTERQIRDTPHKLRQRLPSTGRKPSSDTDDGVLALLRLPEAVKVIEPWTGWNREDAREALDALVAALEERRDG